MKMFKLLYLIIALISISNLTAFEIPDILTIEQEPEATQYDVRINQLTIFINHAEKDQEFYNMFIARMMRAGASEARAIKSYNDMVDRWYLERKTLLARREKELAYKKTLEETR